MRPNDERHFIHGRIIGGISGFASGGVGGAIAGFAGAGRPGATSPFLPLTGSGGTSSGTIAARAESQLLASFGLPPKGGESFGTYFRNLGVTKLIQSQILSALGVAPSGNGNGCEPPLVPSGVQGVCKFPGGPSFGQGELVKGRYGPAEEPFFETRNIRSCLAGFVLGDDKLCYKKGTITNKQRLWPKGTAPLLTGGQMKAIRVAASAGAKLERTTKRLQKIGLMKKPAPRGGIRRHAHARPVSAVSVPVEISN